MKNNEININVEEYEKQRRESILKNGEYARIELILAHEQNVPFCSTELYKVSSMDVAKFLSALQATLEQLKEEFPQEYMLSKIIFKSETIKMKKDLNDNEKKD